jgi:demethylmenaquinone methyltransferase/2-methoxy-6-polyprenyl-1,4-benzoquinol methylase
MSYVYMKVLESAPERYDRGMRILTLGQLERVHRDIAERLSRGDRVLDLGCGTGTLAVMLAHRGVQVTGIDISSAMLSHADQRVRREGVGDLVSFRDLGAMELDTAFEAKSFDAVVSTLVFSELSADEIDYALAGCRRILRPGGRLFVADEVMPASALGQVVTALLRLPFVVVAFLLSQNTTHRVAGLEGRIERAGFGLLEVERYLVGTLRLYVAAKEGGKRAGESAARTTHGPDRFGRGSC